MFEEDEEELELLRQYESQNNYGDKQDTASEEELDSDTEDKIMSLIHYSSGLKKKKQSQVQIQTVHSLPRQRTTSPIINTTTPDDLDSKVNETSIAPKRSISDQSDAFVFNTIQAQAKSIDNNNDDDSSFYDGSSDSDNEYGDTANYSEEEDEGISDDDSGLTEKDNLKGDEKENYDSDVDGSTDNHLHENRPSVTRIINLDEESPSYIDDEEETDEELELNNKLQDLIQDQCAECGEFKHEYRCNSLIYCNNCKRRGHTQRDCEYPREASTMCSRCRSSDHTSSQCPTIVHTYIKLDNPTPPSEPIARYCYSCGSQYHYGDECPTIPDHLRQFRTPFSIDSTRRDQRFISETPSRGSSSSEYRRNYSSERRSGDSRRGGRERERDHSRDDLDDFFGDRTSRYGRQQQQQNSQQYNGNNRRREESNSSHHHQPVAQIQRNRNRHQHEPYPNSREQREQVRNQPRKQPSPPVSQSSYRGSYNNSNNNNNNHNNTQLQRGTGSNNWNAIPQPTRSGTMNVNNAARQQRQQHAMDFPRGNSNVNGLPRPSSSGVIVPQVNKQTGSRYRGGYRR
ncbi:hypothetical protein INT45_008270 [Circinella minor]|uniref:CCHC-type domain-containing protein n=1 Tax=Circinella minor TaxID=1195481 RepID=A0A8H7S5F9_9FUNG|nr:hypothetical protein INT45_008270 [Circinella minor]